MQDNFDCTILKTILKTESVYDLQEAVLLLSTHYLRSRKTTWSMPIFHPLITACRLIHQTIWAMHYVCTTV